MPMKHTCVCLQAGGGPVVSGPVRRYNGHVTLYLWFVGEALTELWCLTAASALM